MKNKVEIDHILLMRIAFMLSSLSFLLCFACHLCEWEQWGPWNNCPCGTVNPHRNRSRGGTCNDSFPGYTCHGYDGFEQCEPFCFNQGIFNLSTGKCQCSERTNGMCCELCE